MDQHQAGLQGWEETKKKHLRRAQIGLLVVVIVDIVVSILLLEDTHNWKPEIWEPKVFFRNFLDFTRSTSDCVICAFARALCLLGLVAFAYWLEARENRDRKRKTNWGNSFAGKEMAKPLLSVANEEDSERIDDHDHHGGDDLKNGKGKTGPLSSSSTASLISSNSSMMGRVETTQQMEVRRKKELEAMERNKTILLAFSFISCTAFQIHAGIKCVSFSFTHETEQGMLMGSALIWINLQLYFMEKLAHWVLVEEGYLWAEVHPHRLYYTKLWFNNCDLCRARVNKGAYRCRTCDFDMCIACFKRKNKSSAEGQLRGDKGMKKEAEVNNAGYMKRALFMVLPHCHLVMLAILCLLATSASSLFLPNFQGRILDQVIQGNKGKFYEDIKWYVILSVAVGAFGGVRGLCFNIIGRKIQYDLRNKFYVSVIHQDIAFFDGTTTGQVTSRLSNDINSMVSPMQTMLNSLLSNLILLIGGLFMCFATSWRLSMLAFTTIGPIIYLTAAYSKWSRGIYRDILAALADANSSAVEALGNIRTVRAFSTEHIEIDKYLEATTSSLKKGMKDAVTGAGTFALTNYLDLGTGVLILWYGGHVVMDVENTLSVGKLITFQLYWNMINSSYKGITDILSEFTRAGGAAQRVLSLIDSVPDISPKGGLVLKKEEMVGSLKLENVSFFYQMRPNQLVLKSVNLEIGAGKVCALVGRSGGGKSTIVHLLMRFYDPKGGAIYLDGKNLVDINLHSLHSNSGLVQQDTQLFALTIEQNIAYGLPNYTREEVIEAAKLANAHDFIMEFEDGYDTRIGERGVRLSGGQKQRLSIARVLVRKPRLLFLDEATSALDTESEALVQTALDKLIKLAGCTVVLVAHRLSTVVNADKIAVIHQGEIVEQGTHDELLKLNGPYSRLVMRQLSRQKNALTDESYDAVDKTGVAASVDALCDDLDDKVKAERKQKALETVDVIDSIMDDLDKEKEKEKLKHKDAHSSSSASSSSTQEEEKADEDEEEENEDDGDEGGDDEGDGEEVNN